MFYTSFIIKKSKQSNQKLIFFGYLAHFNSKKNEEISLDYWNGIENILNREKVKSNWYYFFYPTNIIQKLKDAREYIKNQNNILDKKVFSN